MVYMIDVEFWLDEVRRLYNEGWPFKDAMLFVQLVKLNYELDK